MFSFLRDYSGRGREFNSMNQLSVIYFHFIGFESLETFFILFFLGCVLVKRITAGRLTRNFSGIRPGNPLSRNFLCDTRQQEPVGRFGLEK